MHLMPLITLHRRCCIDPGNDPRYVKYVTDVEVSVFETLIRSLAHGKLEIHRNFPKRESLKDCMERTIPYFLTTIVPNSIKPGKNVLIASSEYVFVCFGRCWCVLVLRRPNPVSCTVLCAACYVLCAV